MKTRKTPIPADSLIQQYLPVDYTDTFECEFTSTRSISSDEVMIAFWNTQPRWVASLFKLRNTLVKPFVLKSDGKGFVEKITECVKTGKTHGEICVPQKSKQETILQVTDSHLIFYLSVIVKEKENNCKTISASTLVNFQNTLGRCYFAVISPFHYFIVKSLLKYIVKRNWIEQ